MYVGEDVYMKLRLINIWLLITTRRERSKNLRENTNITEVFLQIYKHFIFINKATSML